MPSFVNLYQRIVSEKLLQNFLFFLAICTFLASFLSFLPSFSISVLATNYEEAKVEKIYSGDCLNTGGEQKKCNLIDATLFSDDQTLKKITLTNNESFYNPSLGDRIWVSNEADGNYYMQIPKRSDQLLWIIGIFIIATILLIGKKGLRAIFTLGFSTAVIFFVAIPLLMKNPDNFVWIGIGVCGVILVMNILLGQGFKKNAYISLAGSLITLIIVAILTFFFARLTSITGLGSENALFLQVDPSTNMIKPSHIFLVGTLIGVSGALDDVTNAQAVIIDEIDVKNDIKGDFNSSENNSTKSFFNSLFSVYNRGMKLGSTHIASMINTLFLAYLGVGLATILLFQTQSFSHLNPLAVLSRDDFSEEIIRTMVGSFAVIFAIPITTLLAAWIKISDLLKGKSKT